MPKRKTQVIERFGERLAQLRKDTGLTQAAFAAEVGITPRMVAYYEAPDAQPPAHLLPQMAQALGVSVELLLGVSTPRRPKKLATNSASFKRRTHKHGYGQLSVPVFFGSIHIF